MSESTNITRFRLEGSVRMGMRLVSVALRPKIEAWKIYSGDKKQKGWFDPKNPHIGRNKVISPEEYGRKQWK